MQLASFVTYCTPTQRIINLVGGRLASLPSMKAGEIIPHSTFLTCAGLPFSQLNLDATPVASAPPCLTNSLLPTAPYLTTQETHVSKLHPAEFDDSRLSALLEMVLTCPRFSL